MDRKSILIVLISVALIVSWTRVVNHFYPPQPAPARTNLVANPTSGMPADRTALEGTNIAAVVAGAAAPATSGRFLAAAGPEELLTVENDNARYVFTSHGGGLKRVELKRYLADVSCRTPAGGNTNVWATLNDGARAPALALLGDETLQGDGNFRLAQTATGVRAEKLLTNGVRVVKQFELGTNYQLNATVRLENTSAQPVRLPDQEWVIGTATPQGTNDNPTFLGFYYFNGLKAEHLSEPYFENRSFGCFAGTPRSEFVTAQTNIVWAAVHNRFFTMLVTPKETPAGLIARHIDLAGAGGALSVKAGKATHGYQTALLYPAQTLAPQQAVERHFEMFAGPKEYNTLSRLHAQQDLVMEFGGFWGFFPKALLLSMNALNALGLPYGLAIIVITVLLKTLFWPLTQASTKSMKRMAALQPQIAAIKEKYKDDAAKMNQKVMEFMRENKVSPIGGCLPMLLQIPVFIGFYKMLQSAIELRGAQFLWACDLSVSDTIWTIPGLNFAVNPFPIIMGGTMLWQAQLTPPSPGMDPAQQKMMKYMPLMFMVFLYSQPAGLTLYWTVQNLLTITQMKLTRTNDPAAAPGAAAVTKSAAPKKKK